MFQAKCYLAAMNALHLVDQKNAWIVKPLDRVNTGVSLNVHTITGAVGDGFGGWGGVGAYLLSDLKKWGAAQ